MNLTCRTLLNFATLAFVTIAIAASALGQARRADVGPDNKKTTTGPSSPVVPKPDPVARILEWQRQMEKSLRESENRRELEEGNRLRRDQQEGGETDQAEEETDADAARLSQLIDDEIARQAQIDRLSGVGDSCRTSKGWSAECYDPSKATIGWTEAENEKHGLKEGKNGRSYVDDFEVTCWGSNKMFLNTYVTATVVDADGQPSCTGGFLKISNNSQQFPAYFGLNSASAINNQLEPLETRIIPLTFYSLRRDTQTTVVEITLKFWEPE